MDYFEFYRLSVSFNPDMKLVKQQFYALSKQYHPDFYINESAEKQEEVLELATVNNKAYQILSDPEKRLHYILELKGMLAEGESYSLPQEFLLELMEVNEALMELQFKPDAVQLDAIKKEVALIDGNMQVELNRLIASFEGQDKALQQVTLAAIKDLYYRKKYLRRIRESMTKLEAS